VDTAETKLLDLFMAGFSTSDWLRHLNWASDIAQSYAYQDWSITDTSAVQPDSSGNPILDPIIDLYAPTDPTAIYVILTKATLVWEDLAFIAEPRSTMEANQT
jgi:hypothetical protein